MHLTKRAIDGFSYQGPEPRKDIRWDDTLPNFGIRIYPSGKKAFVLSFRNLGRKRLLTIGPYGALTLNQARKRAVGLLGEILEGGDPLASRQKAARGESVGDLCKAYLERHASLKKTGDEDRRRIERHILPRWKNLKAVSITRSDVANLHHEIGQRAPYEANRLLALLRKMFNLAMDWGFIEEGSRNPAQGLTPFREIKRDRWVTPEELPQLAAAIQNEANPYVRAALWLYLLTGARKSEILALTWQDVDLSRKTLRLMDTKSGRTHYVPLSDPTIAVLRDVPVAEGNPHVIAGARAGRPLVNIDKAWRRVRKAAGVDDVRLHDLRRTVGSWLAQSGNSLHLIGRVLNHTNPSTTAVYARFGDDQVRRALDEHGERFRSIIDDNS